MTGKGKTVPLTRGVDIKTISLLDAVFVPSPEGKPWIEPKVVIKREPPFDDVVYRLKEAPQFLAMWRKRPDHFQMEPEFLAKFEAAIKQGQAALQATNQKDN